MEWLLTHNAAAELAAIRARLTASELLAFSGPGARTAQAPVLQVQGSTAHISVAGILTPTPDALARMIAGANTTYESIVSALEAAEANLAVTDIRLEVASPGGTVAGLFELLAALQATKKPMTARCSTACSAAYAIASQAGKVEAVNDASAFGSIGVAVAMGVSDRLVDITSTDAPDKRPNVTTDEGRAVVRRHLDDIHALFAEAIAKGRGVSVAAVNSNFGRGRIVLAREARDLGLIDAIRPKPTKVGQSDDESFVDALAARARAGFRAHPGETPEGAAKRVLAETRGEAVARDEAREAQVETDVHMAALAILRGTAPAPQPAAPRQAPASSTGGDAETTVHTKALELLRSGA